MASTLINFRLDDETADRLKTAAAGDPGGVSAFIRAAIDKTLGIASPAEPAPIDPDAEDAILKAAAHVTECEGVAKAARRVVEDMQRGLDNARASRDTLLAERDAYALGAKAANDPASIAALERNSETLRKHELDVADYSSALTAAERNVAAADDRTKAARRDLATAKAVLIRRDIIAASQDFDDHARQAVGALSRRAAAIKTLRACGVPLDLLPVHRLDSRSRLTRALASSGIGAFCEVDGRADNLPLAQSDIAILGAGNVPADLPEMKEAAE